MLNKKGSPQKLKIVDDLREFKRKCKDDACKKMKQVQTHAKNKELKFDEIEFDHDDVLR